jgi:hypothetical protein
MIFRSILLAGTAALLGGAPALAQSTFTENINNTGIPRNAPALGLSNIYGLNPCATGTSVGVTTPLFGIGGAASTIDKECESRNNAAVVITGLKDELLAREILCAIKDVRDAAIRVGKPCLQDKPPPRIASVAPETPAPKAPSAASDKNTEQVAATPAVTPVAASISIQANAPAFCRVKGLDVSLYPECTMLQPPLVAQAAVAKRPPSIHAGPPWKHPQAAPATADKQAPDASAKDVQTNAAWGEAVSYTPPPAHGGKPIPMILKAAMTVSPAAAVAASPSSDRLAKLLERGSAMVRAGDITAARLLFERAAAAGSSQAAVEIGKTYDPVFLAGISAVGIQADPATADSWYRRAIALGDAKTSGLLRTASQ